MLGVSSFVMSGANSAGGAYAAAPDLTPSQNQLDLVVFRELRWQIRYFCNECQQRISV